MKSRTAFIILGITVGFPVGFWLYGIGRTMRETVNFNTMASLSGLALSILLPLVAFLPFVIGYRLWPREGKWLISPMLVWAVCLLLGSVASECWILRDETQFAAEVSQTQGSNSYSRPRCWPNKGCSLVFQPGKAIHSTD